jgi:hypothetical protein
MPLTSSDAPPAPVSQQEQDSLLLGHHLVDLWTNLCICHNLITEQAQDGVPGVYQVPIPSLK